MYQGIICAVACVLGSRGGEAGGGPFPISISIPECKVVERVSEKDRDFAHVIPGDVGTYIFDEEGEYYRDYQRSYFAVTCKKGGWDCMRHYEILANGAIPYFLGLEECDEKTISFFPKGLIQEAMELEGVSYLKIDHEKFDKQRYFEILEELLAYTRTYLTSEGVARYLLETIGATPFDKILYLSDDPGPDYVRCSTLIGLKQLMGSQVVDLPKIEHIYKSYSGNPHHLYGKGFSYTKIVEDQPVDRENIEERIRSREFDYVLYGSVHRGLRLHQLVREVYDPARIVYICGEDAHNCEYSVFPNLFLREGESFTPR